MEVKKFNAATKNDLKNIVVNTIDFLELKYITELFKVEVIKQSSLSYEKKDADICKCYRVASEAVEVLAIIEEDDPQNIQEELYKKYNLSSYGSIEQDRINNKLTEYDVFIRVNYDSLKIKLEAYGIAELVDKLKTLGARSFRLDAINNYKFSNNINVTMEA